MAAEGVWEDVFVRLAESGGPPATLILDATYVKAHRSAAGGKEGPKRKQSADPAADAPPRSTQPSTSMDGHDD